MAEERAIWSKHKLIGQKEREGGETDERHGERRIHMVSEGLMDNDVGKKRLKCTVI